MVSFEKRLSEVEQALQAAGLLTSEGSLSVDISKIEFQSKPKEIFRRERQGHALSVNGFRDGAVLVILCTVSDPSTHIALLALPGARTWCVQVASNLTHCCSKELLDLWNDMPDRKDINEGTFIRTNGLLALSRFAERFASMQA